MNEKIRLHVCLFDPDLQISQPFKKRQKAYRRLIAVCDTILRKPFPKFSTGMMCEL